MKLRFLHIVWFGLVLSLLGFSQAGGQNMPLPVKDQVPLFLKILTYDSNLAARGETIVVGVVFQERHRASVLAKDDFLAAIRDYPTVGGQSVRVVPLPLSDVATLQEQVQTHGINTLYVAPLRAYDVAVLLPLATEQQILTLSGVPAYIHEGIAVGMRLEDRKPKVMVNLPAAKAQGANFKVQLLRLAEVIR